MADGKDFRVEVTDKKGALLFTVVTLTIDAPTSLRRLPWTISSDTLLPAAITAVAIVQVTGTSSNANRPNKLRKCRLRGTALSMAVRGPVFPARRANQWRAALHCFMTITGSDEQLSWRWRWRLVPTPQNMRSTSGLR